MKTFDELMEKTLTSAEKKKREEIAKAIERENPDMDMSKKMAIATAQAKKVAEEAQLDEYGNTAKGQKMLAKVQKRATDRLIKADDKNRLEPDVSKRDLNTVRKNAATAQRAYDRMKEEVELDELSTDTLKKYTSGAMHDTISGKKDRNAGMKKAFSRVAGVNKPIMNKEEAEQVDELNRSTLQSYMQKNRNEPMRSKKAQAKIPNRVTGMGRALDRVMGRHIVKRGPNDTQGHPMATHKYKKYNAEEVNKDSKPPFDGPYRKPGTHSAVPGKHGEGPSTARHLARMGLKSFMDKDKKK